MLIIYNHITNYIKKKIMINVDNLYFTIIIIYINKYVRKILKFDQRIFLNLEKLKNKIE
jgi:hypothetical protein